MFAIIQIALLEIFIHSEVRLHLSHEVFSQAQLACQNADSYFWETQNPLGAVGHVDGRFESASGYEKQPLLVHFLSSLVVRELLKRGEVRRVFTDEELVAYFLVRVVNLPTLCLGVVPVILFVGDLGVPKHARQEEKIRLGHESVPRNCQAQMIVFTTARCG